MVERILERIQYKVEYYKDGKKNVIRRMAPPRLHTMLPEDKVTITAKKNVDWDEGETGYVHSISPRQPNTLAIKNKKGDEYTFLSYEDLEPRYKRTEEQYRNDDPSMEVTPDKYQYLMWP